MTPADRTALPGLGEPSPFEFPRVATDALPNGIRLSTIDRPRSELVTVLLLLRHGSAADPPGREGLAALTGDLLDEGSRERSGIELHRALQRIGGALATEVTSDGTLVSVTALARFAREAIAHLIEVVARPRFDPDDVDRVRGLRLNRLAQLQRVAGAVADRAWLAALYGSHPYAHSPIGSASSLEAAGAEDVAAFHARHFGSPGWTVIVVGAGAARLRALAAEQLAAVPGSGDGSPSPPPPDPKPSPRRLVLVPRPGAVQSEIRLGHLGAARTSPDYPALLVLNMVLGGQFVSRINSNLREKKGYTYGARTVLSLRRGRGPFLLRAAVETSATTDAIREAAAEIADIGGDRPVSADELDGARAALTRGFARRFETAGQLAAAAMHLALFDLPADDYTRFVPRVAAVDAGAVAGAAARHLHPERLIAVVVGDSDRLLASLGEAGFGEPVEP
ncbi:MAG: pitrilysin family protein [Acidobacteria bacterium]|nr:pitrilysin family protein [Acidobacteriota bacterium]